MSDTTLRLTELRQTCGACPSQWEGVVEDGRAIYVRYRHGRLTWGFGSTIDQAIDAAMAARPRVLGDALDGALCEGAMLREVGLRR